MTKAVRVDGVVGRLTHALISNGGIYAAYIVCETTTNEHLANTWEDFIKAAFNAARHIYILCCFGTMRPKTAVPTYCAPSSFIATSQLLNPVLEAFLIVTGNAYVVAMPALAPFTEP